MPVLLEKTDIPQPLPKKTFPTQYDFPGEYQPVTQFPLLPTQNNLPLVPFRGFYIKANRFI